MRPLVPFVLLGAVACVSGTPRPVPAAAEFQVEASPPEALTAALAAVTAQGLPLRIHDPQTGVLETNYTDLAQYYPEAAQFPRAERLIRFRIAVVPAEVGYGSTVAIEARYSPFVSGGADISVRRERAIPRDHPAMQLVRDMQQDITERTQGR